jgi:hypothetical protein
MTVSQLFLSILGFILFIVLGIVFIRQWAILLMLERLKKQQTEFEQLLRSLQQPSMVAHTPLAEVRGPEANSNRR